MSCPNNGTSSLSNVARSEVKFQAVLTQGSLEHLINEAFV